jgi:hypothetical protein
MVATLSRVVTDRWGFEVMIIHPTADSELNDPAYSPPNTLQFNLPYKSWTDQRSLLVMLAVAATGTVADIEQMRIELIDAEAQCQTDQVVYAELAQQWPDPTTDQQAQISAAKAQVDADLLAIQTVRADIAALKASIP